MRRFYSPPESIDSGSITLGPEETRHLRDVLRLREGDEVRVFDGKGREFICTVGTIGKKSVELGISGETEAPAPESPLGLTLAAALTKGEKFDLVVQKAVELGVTRLVPMITARCDVKLKDSNSRVARWQKIALEASKQCGRAKLMEIESPAPFTEIAAAAKAERTVLFTERGGKGFETLTAQKELTAMIGPEGGWDDAELELAARSGITLVTLNGRILRAETAAIAITAILQHRLGDLR